MKQIKTDDNSITYHNDEYDETYHSSSGAIEEAQKKFVDACNIREFVKDKYSITILDVCFGLGYNTAVAIDNILKANPQCKINVIALENDMKILEEIGKINPDIKSYVLIKELIKKRSDNHFNLNNFPVKIKLLLGDARETIKQVTEKIDFVFLDPFSPKKCPELWTEEFFKDIYNIMKPGSKLATYSCARVVRDNLEKAMFNVTDGPIVGRRSPGTIGMK
jgi:tRNA U34 5-methylaminomethyl-2-thiouridine-forming methyltransferase MnmC